MLTPPTPITQYTTGVVGRVWVRDGKRVVVGNEDRNGVRPIAGAGLVVEATPPFTCMLVCAFVWVDVSDTPTIPFSGAGSSFLSGQLGGSAASLAASCHG